MQPSPSDITRCRRCAERIVWTLTTANGRKQPVNATPDAAGNLAVSKQSDGRLYSRGLTQAHPDPKPGEWRAMPHHATCPAPPPPAKRTTSSGRSPQGVRPVPWQSR